MTTQQDNYLDGLNEVQRGAVTRVEGPVLVVAGPGSGKTRVLTYRIAHIIKSGAAPWEVLALTFTNKAAREMKERIEKVIGPRANSVWAGTFHSIFARILRKEAEHIGYPSDFTIYDSDDSKSVLKSIVKEMNLNKEHYNINALKNRISNCKSNLVTPKRYAADAVLQQEDLQAKRPHFGKVYTKYTIKCKRAGAMDFDDLLYRLFELLQNKQEIREKYQNKFKYLLVDEFQDTNTLQYSILKKLMDYRNPDGSVNSERPRNICVVGDDAQSIYAFRGATIQNILDYERDFKPYNIQTFKLEQNYRSTDHIVQAANEVIMHNSNQIQKKIWSDKGTGARIKVIKANTDQEEGKRIADMIVEMKARDHLSNKDFAILYRTNSQSRIFEEYLRRFNVLYRVYGGLSFYQRKEVKDLIAYLRLAINPNDEEALRRVINFPRRGIGQTTLDKISLAADAGNTTMWQILPNAPGSTRAKNSIADFVKMVNIFRKKALSENAFDAAVFIAKQSKLVDLMKQDTTVEGMNRLENVQSLLDGIKEFVEGEVVNLNSEIAGEEVTTQDKSLSSYLQNIALLTDSDSGEETDDKVTLMSVHAAKGLEFPSVFVVGLEEQLFPSFMSMDTREQLDEERRLFYVAITRAESHLTLSFAKQRYRHGQARYNEPSRFLLEISGKHLDSTGVPKSGTEAFGTARNMGSKESAQPVRSSVSGNMARRRTTVANSTLKVDPKTFRPSPSSEIQAGQSVMHMKFGKGEVKAVDGNSTNRIATIHFAEIDNPTRKIMLKFAKLQIL
ncbi:MAG: DNA helicase-2/ATP-dependent DNA helicase PcrA [Saprospiraceae bacterium]|jgi:DNA helicase-2/ATP-dependent DNA helicase PcrA